MRDEKPFLCAKIRDTYEACKAYYVNFRYVKE